MKRPIFVLLTVLVTAPLWAQVSKTFSWTNPNTYVDGTAMPLANIRETRISTAPTAGGTPTNVQVASGTVATYVSLPVFTAGTWFSRAQTVDVGGAVSAFSNEVSFTVGVCQANPASCTPRPPTGLTVN